MIRIGVLDSGVGGFTVVRPLLKQYPFVSVIYVADTAHVPYSTKSPEELQIIIRRILRFFSMKEVDAVVFACNTSSALVLPQIRQVAFAPFFGVVEPGVKGALQATRGKGVGVAANNVTARSGVFASLLHQARSTLPVIEQGCGELVPFVERGEIDSPRAEEAVRVCVAPFQGKIDTLIFGCTHFPFLQPLFARFLPGVTFVDPAEILVEEMEGLLGRHAAPGKTPAHELWATRLSPGVEEWAQKVLGWKLKARPLDFESFQPWQPDTPRIMEKRC